MAFLHSNTHVSAQIFHGQLIMDEKYLKNILGNASRFHNPFPRELIVPYNTHTQTWCISEQFPHVPSLTYVTYMSLLSSGWSFIFLSMKATQGLVQSFVIFRVDFCNSSLPVCHQTPATDP